MFVDSLIENVPAKDWVAQLAERRGDHGGFNLLLVDGIEYGTRASTVVRVSSAGVCEFEERRFGTGGEPAGTSRFLRGGPVRRRR